jgi:hypothetical protein
MREVTPMRRGPRRSRVSRADLEALGLLPRRPARRGLRTAIVVLVCVAALVSCGVWREMALRASQSAAPTHTPATFAFVRDGQIYLGTRSGAPHQLTRFTRPDADPTHWGPLVWAPDNRHLAVVVGSPLVARDQLATATGALYVVETKTGSVTAVVPQHAGEPGVVVGLSTYGWRDARTLLFAAAGNVFSYALATRAVTPVTGLVGKAIEVEARGAGLYYSTYQTPAAPLVLLAVTLRRHDLATNADAPLADLGLALFQATGCNAVGCQAAPGAPSLAPAWDVSADERQLAFERLPEFVPDQSSATASFWYTALGSSTMPPGAPQRIFANAPSALPAGTPGICCYLRFAPDGHGLVLSSGDAMPRVFGPYLLYTQQLAQSAQVGFPWAFGPAAWAPDAASFTLVAHQRDAPSTTLLTYANQSTVVLQDNAYGCAWAYALGT